MGIYRVQICLQGASGDAEDRYCNTWHMSLIEAGAHDWGTGTLGEDILNMFFTPTTGFYNKVALLGYSSATNNAGATFKIYRLADPEPRTPVYQFTFPSGPFTGTGSGGNLPTEVAVCLSYEAIAVAGTNRARRRGRVYLGPLDTECMSSTVSGAEVNTDFMDGIINAYSDLVDAVEAISGLSIGVYSPTDALFLPAQHAWVDNAFDTQRRRGLSPTFRTEWTHA